MELFLVECFKGVCKGNDDELKLRSWSVLLCFFSVVRELAVNLHSLQGKIEPPLYLTVDLLTLFGPRVSLTMFSWIGAILPSKKGSGSFQLMFHDYDH